MTMLDCTIERRRLIFARNRRRAVYAIVRRDTGKCYTVAFLRLADAQAQLEDIQWDDFLRLTRFWGDAPLSYK